MAGVSTLSFLALTLLVKWQEGHVTHKMCTTITYNLICSLPEHVTWRKKNEQEPAVTPMLQIDRACIRKPRTVFGGCYAPFHWEELGFHLTQCGLGRGLPPYQVGSPGKSCSNGVGYLGELTALLVSQDNTCIVQFWSVTSLLVVQHCLMVPGKNTRP